MSNIFIASRGGHIAELKQLASLQKKDDIVIYDDINAPGANYYLKYANRSNLWRYFSVFWQNIGYSIKILRQNNVKTVISTGSGSVIPFLLICKLFRIKIIYIESFANVINPSLSGKIMYHFANIFYVQHEELLQKLPKARYVGGLF